MKLFITDKGDETVGIFSQTWTVECPFASDEMDDKDLRWFKSQILSAFKEFANGRVVAEYDFEREAMALNEFEQ